MPNTIVGGGGWVQEVWEMLKKRVGGWLFTEQVQKQHTASAATTLAIKAAYGFYDSINLKCSMPNNKIALSS